MVKPPPISSPFPKERVNEQREIRDWHTLVAKLANEAETLRSWSDQPPGDDLDSKIAGTIDKLANGLEGDAARLAQAWPDGEDPSAVLSPLTEDKVPRSTILGGKVDRSA